ncbi:MAG: hypothetical protein FWD46_05405 [Cystobacterineae bacterium]|nr:hypothetical protein [Cystobacterineae bacterium]
MLVYRGEYDEANGKQGRSPAGVLKAGGFYPPNRKHWTVAKAREEMAQYITPEEQGRGYEALNKQMCHHKLAKPGLYVSTGGSENDAYEHYDYMYRCDLPGFAPRLSPRNTYAVDIYMDNPQCSQANHIAVKIQGNEFVFFTPIPANNISHVKQRQKKEKTVEWTEWTVFREWKAPKGSEEFLPETGSLQRLRGLFEPKK